MTTYYLTIREHDSGVVTDYVPNLSEIQADHIRAALDSLPISEVTA